MLAQTDPAHPLHPHHISCPRCGHHNVVVAQDENRYHCLNCNWQRDISEGSGDFQLIPAIIATLLLLLLL